MQWSHRNVVTAAADGLRVPELDDETSAEIDGQLFIELSALTDGEILDFFDVSKRRSRLRELAQVAQEVGPVNGGTCAKSLERDPVTTASDVTLADECHRKDERSRETQLR